MMPRTPGWRRALGGTLAMVLAAGPACTPGGGEAADPLPPVGAEVGRTAPPLEGRLAAGEPFRLDPAEGESTVLVFYRGGHCGLCRERLSELQRHLPAYRSAGARVIAVTPEPPEAAARTARTVGAEYPIVSADSLVLDRWGVASEGTAAPAPATFLLDQRGIIRFRHRGRNAADRVPDPAVLSVLEQQRRGS